MSMSTWRRWAAAGTGGLLAVTLAPAGAAARPDPGASTQWSRPQEVVSVDVSDIVGRAVKPSTLDLVRGDPRVDWPAAGAAQVSVSASASTPAGRVQVEVLDRAATAKAGVDGLVLKVRRADGGKDVAPASISVNYAPFRHAYGGDWASRLRLVPLDGGPAPVAQRNEVKAGRLSAQVPVSASGSTFALLAAPEGSAGDYTATSLSPTGTWQVSTASGGFTWSYPMRVPPVPGDLAPDVTAAYSSQSVDGRVVARNSQPSWLGEGWDLSAGFIERSYKGCASDLGGNNGQTKTGDRCWETHNATMSFGEQSGVLVPVDSHGTTWRLKQDDGTRVVRRTGASNGDDDGEYWEVTTTDGTRYFFGRNRLPGWASGKAETRSAWTAPVFGNDSGEPGYVAGDFAASRRTQAYRWNLDYVVDPHGNAMSYYYGTETNKYGTNRGQSTVDYVRGGWLQRIEYGLRDGNAYAQAPARVVFAVADRCAPGSTCSKTNKSAWPDVPWDQECAAAPCTGKWSPTFWSAKRLTTVTTQVSTGGGNYSSVDKWDLTHQYPNPNDGTTAALWLDRITHTGLRDGTAAMQPVRFVGSMMGNRVNTVTDGLPKLNKMRITAIYNESGGVTNIHYASVDCAGANPATPDANTKRCYPVRWAMPPATEPVDDWFHKYVVKQVVEDDYVLGSAGSGGSKDMVTNYDYIGGGAWAYNDNPLIPAERRTWSQWRGYEKVVVRSGDPVNDAGKPESKTQYHYFRGMHGDKKAAGGTKTVNIVDSTNTSIADTEPLAGVLREEITYNGVGGAEVGGAIHAPWTRKTATHGTVSAHQVETVRTVTRTRLADGSYRRTQVDTEYDYYGNPTQVHDRGDVDVATDDRCTTTTYARNSTKWIMGLPSRVQTVGVACGAAVSYPDDAISDVRTFYDGGAFGAAPTKGNVTRTEVAKSYSGSTPVYLKTATYGHDGYGRVTWSKDALDRQTTTTYTQTHGLTTKVAATNPLGHTATTTKDPARGLPLGGSDANGRVTTVHYDPLGRLTKVWKPGRSEANGDSPHLRFAYEVRNSGGPSWVRTETLVANGNHVSSYQLLDGFLRPRQTQSPSPQGGRIVTDTRYDSRGLVAEAYAPYYNAAAGPGTTLVVPDAGSVPSSTVAVYDGAERQTDSIYLNRNVEKWRTRTYYGGDHTSVVPPPGGTATTAFSDVRGQTTRLLQYHNRPASGPPTGAADTTRYSYTKAGQMATVTDAAGNVWRYEYDVLGRKTRAEDPDKGTSVINYDDAGQPLTVTDARGKTIASVHDSLGRVVETRLGSVIGTLLTKAVFDTLSKGALTSATRYVNGHPYTKEVVGYDSAGRPTGERVVIPEAEQDLRGTYTSSVEYMADGSPKKTTLPMLGNDVWPETLNYTYTDLGQRDSVKGWTTYVSNTEYNALGEVSQVEMEDRSGKRLGFTPYYEEGTRRLVKALTERDIPSSPFAHDAQYAYDPSGNVTSITDRTTGHATDVQCFQNDYLRRTTQAWTPATGDCTAAPTGTGLGGPAPYWHSYTFDLIGNRTKLIRHGGSPAADIVSTYTHPASGDGATRPHAVTSVTTGTTTEQFAYDSAGNMTSRPGPSGAQTLTWNDEGLLASISAAGDQTSYLYDAGGKQLIRRDPGKVTLFLSSGQVTVNTATKAKTGTRIYAGIGVRTGSGFTWTVADRHGTNTVAVNSTTLAVTPRRMDPFGNPRGTNAAWPGGDRGFVGGFINDGTGLTRLGAREYDPAIGRFISVDPIIDPADPQQMNAYAYSNNNPATMSDPDGLRFWCPDGDCGGKRGPNGKNIKKNTPAKAIGTAYYKARYPKARSYCDGCHYQAYKKRLKQGRSKFGNHGRTWQMEREAQKLAHQQRGADLARQDVQRQEVAGRTRVPVDRVSKPSDGPVKSVSVCADGEGGAGVGGAVSVCVNADRKGITFSGMLEVGYYYGFGASAALRVRGNSKPADEVDIGHTSSLTRAVELEGAGVHGGAGVEIHDPHKPGQVSGFVEFGLGTPIGFNFGSFMYPLGSFNSGYLDLSW